MTAETALGMAGVAALEIRDVSVQFGGVKAVSSVSLTAHAGSVTGLIGPNGAGKTTLFNVITGLQSATSGTVHVASTDVTKLRPTRRARLGVARTFQRLEMFGSLTAYDNILTAAEFRRRWSDDDSDPRVEAHEILERVGLTAVAGERADALPTGNARLIELGRALASHPLLLLLDEPGSGLDDSETNDLADLLLELSGEGMAVLLVEHDVELVMRICHTIHVLDQGKLIAGGTAAEVTANAAVQLAYLGE
jgi:branched-chain amino acid transport system ATP-binding protein